MTIGGSNINIHHMHTNFDTLIDSYIETSIGESEQFLSKELSTLLIANIVHLYATNTMTQAGTGNQSEAVLDQLFRSDKIHWLDRIHNNSSENTFFDVIDLFIAHLNATCYTGITGYEFHYAMYEKGSFYKKHVDQFHHNKKRAYTMIMYLNENWQDGDGGELCIHHTDHLQLISPNNGKGIFFKSSDIEHEVLLTHKTRMSITGWLRTD
jgi:SM-20-related protein